MPSFLPNFFQVNKPKSFNYVPRYYDAEKERLEKLKQKYAEKGEEEELAEMKVRISDEFKRQRPVRKTDGLLTRTKLYIYLAIIALLVIFLLK